MCWMIASLRQKCIVFIVHKFEQTSELHIYIWSENLHPRSEAKDGDVQCLSFLLFFSSCFHVDLKNTYLFI